MPDMSQILPMNYLSLFTFLLFQLTKKKKKPSESHSPTLLLYFVPLKLTQFSALTLTNMNFISIHFIHQVPVEPALLFVHVFLSNF